MEVQTPYSIFSRTCNPPPQTKKKPKNGGKLQKEAMFGRLIKFMRCYIPNKRETIYNISKKIKDREALRIT